MFFKLKTYINSIQTSLFFRLKIRGGGLFGAPLMISGTIQANQVKLCTVIALLKAYQNTKINDQKSDL